MIDRNRTIAGLMDAPPPSDKGAEQALLRVLLYESHRMPQIAAIVQAGDFSDESNRVLFQAIQKMEHDGEPVDAVTMYRYLAENRQLEIVGGAGRLAEIFQGHGTPGFCKRYAETVAEKAQLHRLKAHATELLQDLADGKPADELIAAASDRIADMHRQLDTSGPRHSSLSSASQRWIDTLAAGKHETCQLGLPDLDRAIGGGVLPGEMIVLGARPSHGKSMVALQCLHHWTSEGHPACIISEEMSSLALGKRTLQFISDCPVEHWPTNLGKLRQTVADYRSGHAPCVIIESCGTTSTAVAQIAKAVNDHGVRFVVVDYAQLLSSPGRSRYEQVTNTSIAMKQAAVRHNVVLILLCQLSRDIESRQTFAPVMSDLRESGQLEQDADVILFGVWPHRIDQKQPAHAYTFYVAKNRNRPIVASVVGCEIHPSRQRIDRKTPENYSETLGAFGQ